MDIEILQQQIDKTDYWDMPILDVQIKWFGDEINIFIEKDKENCWQLTFINCYKVNYDTDAGWVGMKVGSGKQLPSYWRTMDVKDMKRGQLGYFGQDICIKKFVEDENFIESTLDLSIMMMRIVCRDILVKERSLTDLSFFLEE